MAVKKTNKILGIEREHDGVSLDSLLDKWYNEEKLTTYEIAEKCNVTDVTIGNWMEKYGMERRSISEIRLSSDAYKPNKEELDQWYNEEGKTLTQIAEKCNVGNTTIRRWMEKYGMERRPTGSELSPDAYKPTEEELEKWYNEEGQTLSEIAEKCDVGPTTISVWMDKYGIERRPAAHLPKEPEYTIEQGVEAYLKYEKTTAIPVDLRTFFNIFDPETLQRAEGTPPLRVYISRWKKDRR